MNLGTANSIAYRLLDALPTSVQWHRLKEVNEVITVLSASKLAVNKEKADMILDGMTEHIRMCNVCKHTA